MKKKFEYKEPEFLAYVVNEDVLTTSLGGNLDVVTEDWEAPEMML